MATSPQASSLVPHRPPRSHLIRTLTAWPVVVRDRAGDAPLSLTHSALMVALPSATEPKLRQLLDRRSVRAVPVRRQDTDDACAADPPAIAGRKLAAGAFCLSLG